MQKCANFPSGKEPIVRIDAITPSKLQNSQSERAENRIFRAVAMAAMGNTARNSSTKI
jgi:hypothetical protein